ncbi:MAG: Iron transporter ATP-binding protein [Ilumatobacteraceae bacterium]|nr:Iron transporter ATP-binding protein [Ilumatobacteraceae bacterium]
MSDARSTPTLELDHVSFIRDDRRILDDVTWSVRPDERWLILGANGSGKTTMVRIASMYEHPSKGTVRVLGETLGSTDVRILRRRIGVMSAAIGAQLRPALTAREVVVTAKFAALEPWWHTYTDEDNARADACLERMGVGHYAHRSLGTLSSGEQQRVLLARALMNEPGIVVLDEPSARLDLGGREQLVQALAELTADPASPPLVLVTHHVDEVPPGMTHALLLREGEVLIAGALDDVLTAESLSECFAMSLVLERRGDGRLTAWSHRSG